MNSTTAAMSGNAAKMVADSTVPEPVKTKKKKKLSGGPKSKKKKTNIAKRAKERADLLAISNLHSDSDSELDLKKTLKPISGYIKVRSDMMEQMFHSVWGPSLQRTLPDILKDLPIEDLKRRCLEQLENMSKKRIRRIICGDKPEDISSSGTEESTDEDEEEGEKPDADSTSQPADTGAANLADIEIVDDEQLLADVASAMNKTSHTTKKVQSATASPNTDAGVNLNIAPLIDHSELEILELEMRARAIKAMLRASVQRTQDSSEQGGSAEPGSEQSGTIVEAGTKDKQALEKGKSLAQQNTGKNSPFENASSKLLGQKTSMQIIIGKKANDPINAGKKADEKKADGQKKTEDEDLVKLLEEQKRKAALEKPDTHPGTEGLPIKTEKAEADKQPAKDLKLRRRSYSTSRSRSRSRSRSGSGSERRRYRRRSTSDSSRSDDSRDSRHSRHIRRRRQYRKRRRSSSRSVSDSYSSDESSDPHRHKYPLQTSRFNPNPVDVKPYFPGPMKRMKWVKKPKKSLPVEEREEGEVSDVSEWEQVTDDEYANVVIKIEPDDDSPRRAKNRNKLLTNKAIKTEPGVKTNTHRIHIKVEPSDSASKQNKDSGADLREVQTTAEDVQIMVPLSTLEYITIESSDSDMDSVSSAPPDVAAVAPAVVPGVPEATPSIDSNVVSVPENATASIISDIVTSVGTSHIKVEKVSSSVSGFPVSEINRVVKMEPDSEKVLGLDDRTLCLDTHLPITEVIDSTSSESDEKSIADSCISMQESHNVGQSEDQNQKYTSDQPEDMGVDTSCSEMKPTQELSVQSSTSPHISVQSSEKPDSVKSNEEPDSDVITISSTGKGASTQAAGLSQQLDADLEENVGVQSSGVVVPERSAIDMDDSDTIDGLPDIACADTENKVLNTSEAQHEGIEEAESGPMSETTKNNIFVADRGVSEGAQGGGSGVASGVEGAGSVVEEIEDSSDGSVSESDEEVQNVSDDEESQDIQDWSDLEGKKAGGSAIQRDMDDSQGVSQKQGDKEVSQDGSEKLGNNGVSEGRSDVGKRHQDIQIGCGVEAMVDNPGGSCDESGTHDADSDSNVSQDNSRNTEHETDTENTDVGDEDDTTPVVTATAGQIRQRAASNDDAVVLDDDNEILD